MIFLQERKKMKDKYFFDSNIFIYAVLESSNDQDIKKKISSFILD
jgi:predicted nucleic acid-binding protein